MRGKVVQLLLGLTDKGITPACAGKSQNGRIPRESERDHPRVCGEKPVIDLHRTRMQGSPPRVRGKGSGWHQAHCDGGITPACAGKSQNGRIPRESERDHPRVCGEKRAPLIPVTRARGSPPRVRGKAEDVTEMEDVLRITPACAGKSLPCAKSHGKAGDHPRVCGEKRTRIEKGTTGRGSPPRVRGKDFLLVSFFCDIGITPACAGKSPDSREYRRSVQDHPRVCGEKDS